MKLKNALLVFTLAILGIASQAQNSNFDKGISVRALFMDYQSQQDNGSITAFNDYHHGFEFAYHHRLNENVKFVLPVNVGQVSSHLLQNTDINKNCLHKTVYGVGGQLQYEFGNLQSKIVPYVVGGLDAVFEDEGDFNLQIPVGFGLNFQQNERAYWFWQSDYRFSLADNRNNLHHGLGFVYLWDGESTEKPMEIKDELKSDADGDGIEDALDLCPNAAGPKGLSGCPDRDGDAIADYEDKCPDDPGLKNFNGCPDTDGDGVSDMEDECPNMVGLLANKGCPDADRDNDGVPNSIDKCPDIPGTVESGGCPGADSDGDGIADAADKCPNEKGTSRTDGCPDRDGDGVADYADKCINDAGLAIFGGCPDTDGDGIDDSRDKCPSQPGSVANNGCPGIDAGDLSTLETAMRAVQFNTGKATLKSESYPVLNQISAIMDKYPGYNLMIEGHTDNVGSAVNNQLLSERRAQACFEYLVRRGVSSSRMSHTGYGETTPISDNNSLSGRALNRRVAFNLKAR